ncbi:MAG TPA: class I SAM-dependent methyltransferase [Bacteroidota bacterium]|nr:class I SAM-dependent methyltransferase [Bacteroidota bacterium]
MDYDPIKKVLADFVGTSPSRRRMFYTALGILFLREWYVKRELRTLMRTSTPPRRILDAGSGFGQYAYYLARRFPHASIVAVDVKEAEIKDSVDFFQKVGLQNVKCEVHDLGELQHREEFDLVLSVDVMEHIEDDRRVFGNLARSLRGGGVLLVNTPANLSGRSGEAIVHESFIGEHVRYGYAPEELKAKLEEAGLAIERLRFTYGQWGYSAWVLGIKLPLLLLNKNKAFFFLLPIYYILTLPLTLLLMTLDYVSNNKSGGGLLVIARKK